MKALKILCLGLKYLFIGGCVVGALLMIAGFFLSCNTVKKSYSKKIESIDSVSHVSSDSVSVKTDKGIVTDLKEGEYERWVYEYPILAHVAPLEVLIDTSGYSITKTLSRITYERGKTLELHTEVKDKKDSAAKHNQSDTELQKEEKTIEKEKESSRFPWFPLGCFGIAGVIVWRLWFFMKNGR